MADGDRDGASSWRVRLFAALAALALIAWVFAAFTGCRHAGLV